MLWENVLMEVTQAMAKLVNLTPHSITFVLPDRQITIGPSGTVARCSVEKNPCGAITLYDGAKVLAEIPLNQNQYGEVTGLPDPQPDTYYIVSLIVAQALRGKRDDVLVVDDTVRDSEGRIIGARALARL